MSNSNTASGCLILLLLFCGLGVAICVFTGDGTERAEREAGQAKKDSEIELYFRRVLQESALEGVLSVRVHETLLYLEITPALYRHLVANRADARILSQRLIQEMRQQSGSQAVTVYYQVGGQTVIEADVTLFSGIQLDFKGL